MTVEQIITAIEHEPLARLKQTSYDAQLVEAVRQDILKLIMKLDQILDHSVVK
jgi:hypothetical protein